MWYWSFYHLSNIIALFGLFSTPHSYFRIIRIRIITIQSFLESHFFVLRIFYTSYFSVTLLFLSTYFPCGDLTQSTVQIKSPVTNKMTLLEVNLYVCVLCKGKGKEISFFFSNKHQRKTISSEYHRTVRQRISISNSSLLYKIYLWFKIIYILILKPTLIVFRHLHIRCKVISKDFLTYIF